MADENKLWWTQNKWWKQLYDSYTAVEPIDPIKGQLSYSKLEETYNKLVLGQQNNPYVSWGVGVAPEPEPTNANPAQCICRGAGHYFEPPETETVWFLTKEQADAYASKPIEPIKVHCKYHGIKPENVQYPDGWDVEDLVKWCKDKGVPEPPWLPEMVYSRFKSLGTVKVTYTSDWATTTYANYPGGIQVAQNLGSSYSDSEQKKK